MLCLSLWSWCGPLWPLGWGPWPGASLPRHSEQLCGGCIVSLSTPCTGCYTGLPARELSSHCPVSAVVGGLGTWKDRALQDQENHELRLQPVKQLLGVGVHGEECTGKLTAVLICRLAASGHSHWHCLLPVTQCFLKSVLLDDSGSG